MPSRLVLHPGEERKFQLTGMGSAGYAWEWEISSEGVVEVDMQGKGRQGGEASGCSAPVVLLISASRPGLATLRLVLRRPFADQPPREQHSIEIEVAA